MGALPGCARSVECLRTEQILAEPVLDMGAVAQPDRHRISCRVDFDAAEGSKLTGQAVLTLSTGRRFDYQISGTENLKRGSAILRLKGINEATTSSLTLYTQGVDQTLLKLQGRLLGQKLKVP